MPTSPLRRSKRQTFYCGGFIFLATSFGIVEVVDPLPMTADAAYAAGVRRNFASPWLVCRLWPVGIGINDGPSTWRSLRLEGRGRFTLAELRQALRHRQNRPDKWRLLVDEIGFDLGDIL